MPLHRFSARLAIDWSCVFIVRITELSFDLRSIAKVGIGMNLPHIPLDKLAMELQGSEAEIVWKLAENDARFTKVAGELALAIDASLVRSVVVPKDGGNAVLSLAFPDERGASFSLPAEMAKTLIQDLPAVSNAV